MTGVFELLITDNQKYGYLRRGTILLLEIWTPWFIRFIYTEIIGVMSLR